MGRKPTIFQKRLPEDSFQKAVRALLRLRLPITTSETKTGREMSRVAAT